MGKPTWKNWHEEEQIVWQKRGQAHIEKLVRGPRPAWDLMNANYIRPDQRKAGCLTLTRKPSSSPGGLFPLNLSRNQDQPGTIAGANSRVDLPKCRGLPSAPDPDTSAC